MRTLLDILKTTWMRLVQFIGRMNTIILLTVTYIIVLGIISILARLFGVARLDKINESSISYWKPKSKQDTNFNRNKLQF
jgi:Fe2+ transport system protein B